MSHARIIAVCVAILLTGCAATSRLVPPAQIEQPGVMEMVAEPASPLRLVVRGIILTNSTGSWVRDAQWIEYLVALENTGETPIRVESLRLNSALPAPSMHATSVRKLSDGTYENLRTAGNVLGTAAVSTMIPPTVGIMAMAATSNLYAAASAMTAAVPIAAAGGVIYLGFTTFRDQQDMERIELELGRRGLALPLILAPRQTVAGSAFFPLTPHPHRMTAAFARVSDDTLSGQSASRGESTIDMAFGLESVRATAIACRKIRLLDEPAPLPPPENGLGAADDQLTASVVHLVVPNGAGSWVRDAGWDEYRLAMRSLSPIKAVVLEVTLDDSLGRTWPSEVPRCAADHPHLIPGVKKAIENRNTRLPLELRPGDAAYVAFLFPVSPLARSLSITYRDTRGDHRLHVDLQKLPSVARATAFPLLVRRVEPEFPAEAVREGIRTGQVRIRLTVDRYGVVRSYRILESSHPGLFDTAAARAVSQWQYLDSDSERSVEAVINFSR